MSAARDLPDTFAAPPQPSPRSDVEIYRMWEIYKAVKAGGEVVNLLVGEPTLPPSPKVVAAASRALNDGRTIAYTEALGIDRKSVVSGQSVSVRVDLGGLRIIKNKTTP